MAPSRSRRRWVMLAVGCLDQAAGLSFVLGLPFVIPQLQQAHQLSLGQAGLLVSAPSFGLLLTLLLWGALADRFGERIVIVLGLTLAGGFLLAATRTHGLVPLGVLLMLAGAASASVNAASGRVVLGWFAPHERGLAMGIRQAAQPVAVGFAALTFPALARAHGVAATMLLPALLCLAVAVLSLLLIADPPQAPARGSASRSTSSPYRASSVLLRVHLASSALVVPQFVAAVFVQVYLVSQRGWDPVHAGQLVFLGQMLGVLARLSVGWWSDRVGSRLGPMRIVAIAVAMVMAVLAIAASTHASVVVVFLVLALPISVAPNGLAFTSVAELAGLGWAGRALGTHNTMQNTVATVTPSVMGAVIGAVGFGWGFAIAAVFPVLAVLALPMAAETGVRRQVRLPVEQGSHLGAD